MQIRTSTGITHGANNSCSAPGGLWLGLFILASTVVLTSLARKVILPWVGILAKWLIIGRYKAGVYPVRAMGMSDLGNIASRADRGPVLTTGQYMYAN